jgi:hypothetical protein
VGQMTRLTATTDDNNTWSRHLDSVGGRRRNAWRMNQE